MEEEFIRFVEKSAHGPHEIQALHMIPDLAWEEVKEQMPHFPRGWYELSRLSSLHRVEFVGEYWRSMLQPVSLYPLHLERDLDQFFGGLEEIGIYLWRLTAHDPLEAHMVYMGEGGRSWFQGGVGASEEWLVRLKERFPQWSFPPDYLAFLRIHDGFSQGVDTGLLKSNTLARVYQLFQRQIGEIWDIEREQTLDPKTLLPFYESEHIHSYQCFCADWYPETEMGNCHYNLVDGQLPNQRILKSQYAYPSFLDWFGHYLCEKGKR